MALPSPRPHRAGAGAPGGEGPGAESPHRHLVALAKTQLKDGGRRLHVKVQGARHEVAQQVGGLLEEMDWRPEGGGSWHPQSKDPLGCMLAGDCPRDGLKFRCKHSKVQQPKQLRTRVLDSQAEALSQALAQAGATEVSRTGGDGVVCVECRVEPSAGRVLQQTVADLKGTAEWVKPSGGGTPPPPQGANSAAGKQPARRGPGVTPSNRCGCKAHIVVRWKCLPRFGRDHTEFTVRGTLNHSEGCTSIRRALGPREGKLLSVKARWDIDRLVLAHPERTFAGLAPMWRAQRRKELSNQLCLPEEEVERRWLSEDVASRDNVLKKGDVANARRRTVDQVYKLLENEEDSVEAWVDEHPELVLFYQQQVVDASNPEVVLTPFVLVLADSWQIDNLIEHGHERDVQMDR